MEPYAHTHEHPDAAAKQGEIDGGSRLFTDKLQHVS